MDSGRETVDFTSYLPDELLLLVLAHLSYKDLCRTGCVCQRLRYLIRNDILWRRLCHVHWLDVPPVEDGSGDQESPTVWYRTFQRSYQQLGDFIGCYSIVKGHWNRIEAGLKERGAVDILESLRDPIQEHEILSEALELSLPADVLCSLHIHDGQETFDGDEHMLGLAGLVRVYGFQSCPVLLSHRTMVSRLRELKGQHAKEQKGQLLHTVAVLECPVSRISIRICLNSIGDFQTGNMFYCHHDHVLEPSFSWPNEGFFLLAKSFTDWLAQLADRLLDPGTIFHQSSLSRFYLEPSCVAVTEHVKVSVATTFISEMSEKPLRPGRKMFAYYITLAMDEKSPRSKSCQLRTRHWVITDTNGRVETVNGAGVVGDFPIIQPGTSYSWASYTSFVTSSGSMGGHFGMVNLETRECFHVKCPDFHLRALPYLRLPELSEELGDHDPPEQRNVSC